jgi:hypothetical protein
LNFLGFMYTEIVRCGNLIVSQEQINPMVFWWGMKKVSRVGNHGEGNLEDSWRTNTLPMPTGHAPPKRHGVFLFGLTGLHSLVRPQPGGVEEKGTRYDFGLGGSSRTIRATGRIVKSGAHRKSGGMTIPSGGETFVPSYLMSGVGGSLGEKVTQGAF